MNRANRVRLPTGDLIKSIDRFVLVNAYIHLHSAVDVAGISSTPNSRIHSYRASNGRRRIQVLMIALF